MALAMLAGHLYIWHIGVALAINSILGAFQWPAFVASITLLIPKRHFGRASGLVGAGEAIGQIVSPALGGALVLLIKIEGIFIVDFATFIFSLAILLIVRIPKPITDREGATKESFLSEASYGLRYVVSHPGLSRLLIFFALTNFFSGFILVLITPLVLGFTTASALGVILSVGGVGLLAGSLAMSAWGGPKRKMNGVFGFTILGGICFILAGFRPSAQLVAMAAFFYFFSRPFITGCTQAIWQCKIPPDIQGRVFAIRRMIAWSTLPLARSEGPGRMRRAGQPHSPGAESA